MAEKHVRMWADVFHMWYPYACESVSPAMSVSWDKKKSQVVWELTPTR